MAARDVTRDEIAAMLRDFSPGIGSPLYARLAAEMADDADILDLFAEVRPQQRRPVILFAAVHDLVLREGRAYPSDLASFHAFAAEHHADLRERLATRSTQTNEIGRCSAFRAALATFDPARPLRLVDVGCSAGLNLLLDRWSYTYPPHGRIPGPEAVTITCAADRARPPMGPIPEIAARVGVDLHPVDVHDAEQARWLRACVWPDQPDRLAQLTAAIEVAQRTPLQLLQADALDAPMDGGETTVVMHSWALSYLDADHQRAFAARVRESGATWLFAEQHEEVPGLPVPLTGHPRATALVLVRPGEEPIRLADLHPHGRWLHWLV